MGLFDFLKKKPQEPVVQQTEEHVVEVEGIRVETEPQEEADIVLNVDTRLGTTTAINQAVHEVMDEEEIDFHEKAGGTLYRENEDIAAERMKEAAQLDTEWAKDIQTEAEQNIQIQAEEKEEELSLQEGMSDDDMMGESATGLTEEPAAAEIETERSISMQVKEKEAEIPLQEEMSDELEEKSAAASTEEPKAEKKGFFSRLKAGLDKTRKNIFGNVDTILGSFTKIDEELFEELEEAVILADMGVETTMHIVERLRQRVKKERATDPAQIRGMLIDEITEILQEGVEEEEQLPSPSVMLVIGVNGVGKTTTIGKLAHNFKQEGKSVLLAAADTFRAAAIDQLEIWGQRAGIEVIRHEENADPAAVVYDAAHEAKRRKTDLLICDTAGRLHNKKNLMEELRKISRVIEREYPAAHKETYLVLDATTGQNALMQAKEFMGVTEITGIILTKLDGTAKGGIVVAIKNELKIPVRYIGVGEGMEDLQKFNAIDFARALFGETE